MRCCRDVCVCVCVYVSRCLYIHYVHGYVIVYRMYTSKFSKINYMQM